MFRNIRLCIARIGSCRRRLAQMLHRIHQHHETCVGACDASGGTMLRNLLLIMAMAAALTQLGCGAVAGGVVGGVVGHEIAEEEDED
jgi:hypothetical protein